MRVRLKGINRVRKQLADGTWVTYYYLGKGGPPIKGDPGSPEFLANYNAAAESLVRKPKEQLRLVLDKYEQSPAYSGLAEATRVTYKRHLKQIESDFGDLPLSALTDPKMRGIFLDWRDARAASSRRSADGAMTVLALILAWALNRGLVLANPCTRPGRLYRSNRVDKVWTEDDEAAFYRKASAHLHLPLLMALWTGQRQGDLLRLKWAAYDGSTIRLRQQKTGMPVVIPVGGPLRKSLDAEKLVQEAAGVNLAQQTILQTTRGTPWTSMGFSASWRKACANAGIVGLTFHDLRGTAVTRLGLAGCSEIEVATITGHSLRDVGAILDAHYMKRDPRLGESAIRKLEASLATPN